MKRKIRCFFSFVLLVFNIVIIIGCSDVSKYDNESIIERKVIYFDEDRLIEYDDLKIEITSIYCNERTNCSLGIYIDLFNKDYSAKEYKIKNINLIKENTDVNYSVYYDEKITIGAELKGKLHFSATIPSSIDDDKYKIDFEINYYKFTLYLYERPDELREDRYINYYISGNFVKTDVVKNNRKLEKNYLYESSDHLYYCDTWYVDESMKTEFRYSTLINSNINLYGRNYSVIKWSTTSSDVYSFINGINHVPLDGILVIPNEYRNKEICIGNFAIKDVKLKKIYIPNTVRKIYNGNFKNINNATIYYEGTEEEWKNLFYFSFDIYTTTVVYNVKYVI